MSLKEIAHAHNWEIYKAEFVNPAVTLENQTDLLYEDMCWVYKQLSPEVNIAIDVGWYGESFSTNGLFKLYVIKNNDWDNPVFTYPSVNPGQIISMFQGVISIIDAVHLTA
ncbi:MAG TPA: hypothetical protein VK174_01875 [Chitinophagales bacterium]|nr:hypothetical protein [Chitinophagales bacterium]